MAFASRSLRVTCLALLVALCGACRQRPPTPPSKPPVDPGGPNAATGFDNLSNGVVTDATHREDLAAFDDVEQIALLILDREQAFEHDVGDAPVGGDGGRDIAGGAELVADGDDVC